MERLSFTVPLIAVAIIQFSLINGVCPEAVVFFATFSLYKIFLQEDYSGAKYWADLARAIIISSPNMSKNSEIRAELLLVGAFFDVLLYEQNCFADCHLFTYATTSKRLLAPHD